MMIRPSSFPLWRPLVDTGGLPDLSLGNLGQICLDALNSQKLNLDVLEFDTSLKIAMRRTYPQQAYAYSREPNRRPLAAVFRAGSHVFDACCFPSWLAFSCFVFLSKSFVIIIII
jgi:hypothetical protein